MVVLITRKNELRRSRADNLGVDDGIWPKFKLIQASMHVLVIGRFQSIKTGVLLIFSFITGDKTEFLSSMIISNEYITGI